MKGSTLSRQLDRARARVGVRLFELLYGALAPFYDAISRFFFAGQWALWQASSLDYIGGPRVLELGCGTGDLLVELCRRGYAPLGVDASPQMLRIARRKLGRAGCKAVVLRAPAWELPFADASIDAVVSTFPSGYIMHPGTWLEARRVLRPGGRFVIVLGGELLPVDHCSRLLIKFHKLVYGRNRGGTGVVEGLSFPGFALQYVTRCDDRGIAHLLLADATGA